MGAEFNAGRVVVEIGAINNTGATFKNVATGLTGLENNFKKSGNTIKNSMGDSLKSVNSQMDQFGTKVSKGLTTPFQNLGSKISSALSGAKNSILSFASSAGSALNGLVGVGQKVYDKIGLIGTLMVGVFTTKLKSAISEATNVFMTFDDQMRKVQAVTESSGETFDKLTAQAKLLGATTSFTAQEAADAMTQLGQAGFDANEVIAAMPATLNLARGSMTDLATTADIMSNIMNGFQIAAEDTTRVSDVLSKAANATNTDVTQLGQAMKYVAPLAFQMGWSLEETASAAGLLSNAGIKSSMAGTVLRNAISRLLSPTQKAAGILQSYGITLDAISPKTHSFAQIVDLLSKSGISAGDIMQVFGMRAGPGLLAMMNIGTGAIQEMNQTLYDSTGYAQKAADMMDAGWGGVVRRLGDAVEALQISFGGAFAKILTPFAEIISRVGVAVSQLPESILMLGAALALVAVVAGTALTALAALPMVAGVITAGMSALAVGLTSLASAWGGMAGSATLGSIALGAATASMSSIIVTVGGVVAAVAGLGLVLWEIEQKTQVFSKTWTFLKDSFTIASYVIGKAIENISTEIKKKVEDIIQWLTNLAEDTHLMVFVDAVTGVYDRIKSSLGKTADSVHESAESIRVEKAKLAESEENVRKQVERAHDGTLKSYNMVDEATGQTYASMIENAESGAEGITTANGDIVSSNQDVIDSNNALSASSPTVSFNIENSDIASIIDPTKGQAVVTNDALIKGIELADGALLTYNKDGQLIIETLDGIQKRVYDIGNTKLETASGSKIWTIGGKATEDNGRKISVAEATANNNAIFGDDKAKHKAGSGLKKDAEWQRLHPNDSMIYLNPDGRTGPSVGKRALTESEQAKIKEGKWTKPITSMSEKSTPVSGEELNKRIATDNELYGNGELKPKGFISLEEKEKRDKAYKEALKGQKEIKKRDAQGSSLAKKILSGGDDQGWTGFFKSIFNGKPIGGKSVDLWGTLKKTDIKTPGMGNVSSGSFAPNISGISEKYDSLKKKMGEVNSFSFSSLKGSLGTVKQSVTDQITNSDLWKSTVGSVDKVDFGSLKNQIFGVGEEETTASGKGETHKGILDRIGSTAMNFVKGEVQGIGNESDTSSSKAGFLETALGLIDKVSLPNIQTEISNTATRISEGIKSSDLFKSSMSLLNSVSFSGLLTSISKVSGALDGLITSAKTMYSKVSEYVTNAYNKATGGSGGSNKSAVATTNNTSNKSTVSNTYSYYVNAYNPNTSQITSALKRASGA